jgi:hypothetical protein
MLMLLVHHLLFASSCCLKDLKLRSFIPLEFARRPRSVSEADRWMAIEFRQLLLYIGPVVLPEILSESVFTYFMLLSVDIRLSVSSEFCEK